MFSITQETIRHPYKEPLESTPGFGDCNNTLDRIISEKSEDFVYLGYRSNSCLRSFREYCREERDPNTPIIKSTEIYWMMEYEVYAYMVIEGVLLVIVFLIILYKLKKKWKTC